MLRKILPICLLLAVIANVSFAQEAVVTSVATNDPVLQEFVDALIEQDISLLIYTIENGSPEVKAVCLNALAKREEKTEDMIALIDKYILFGLDPTTSTFDEGSRMVRFWAAQAASTAKSETSVKPLSDMLRLEKEVSNIVAAVYALGEIGLTDSSDTVLYYLRGTQNPDIVYACVVALGKIGNPQALGDLATIAQDKYYSAEIRRAAIAAMKSVQTKQMGEPTGDQQAN